MSIIPFLPKSKAVAAITIEHGFIKMLMCRGTVVVDHRIVPVNPRFFREGMVRESARVGTILSNTLQQMSGNSYRTIGAVPGFQNAQRVLELPRVAGMNPQVVLPQEAARIMRVSPENSFLTWYRLPDRLDRSRWLVLVAGRRGITSLVDTAEKAGVKIRSLELRPFALARAVNQPEAVIAWVSLDGCDVVVVRNWIPVAHQSMFWGAEVASDTNAVIYRLTEVVGRTVATYNEVPTEEPLSEEVLLYVCGSPVAVEQRIAVRLGEALGRPTGELSPPLSYPADFPVQDLIVNMGLVLGAQ